MDGSNIDLGTIYGVDKDIRKRQRQLEEAMAKCQEMVHEYNYKLARFHEAEADAFTESARASEKITERKAWVKTATVEQRVEMMVAENLKHYAEERVRACKALLTSTQSRASLIRTQWELDTKGESR